MENTLETKLNKLISLKVIHLTAKGKYKLTASYLHGQEEAFKHLKEVAPEEHDWVKSFESPQAFHYCINNDIEYPPVCSICGKPLILHTTNGTYKYSRTCSEECRVKQIETTNRKNHNGVWNFQTSEFSDLTRKTSLERYGCEDPAQAENIKKKRAATRALKIKKEKTGLGLRDPQKDNVEIKDWSLEGYHQSEGVKEKRKQTTLEKYGYENVRQAPLVQEKAKQTCLDKYGVLSYSQTRESRQKIHTKVRYKELCFDSYPELAFYIYCKDNNINIEREPDIELTYFDESKQMLRRYFPDFKVEGKLVEIKSRRWWNIATDSYRNFVSSVSKVFFEEDYQKYIDYVDQTYGKGYLKLFKNS